MPERQDLTEIYPEELRRVFPTLEEKIEAFLAGNGKKVVTVETTTEEVKQCAEGLQTLAKTIATGISNGSIDPVSLYLQTTQPARAVGEVAVGSPEQVGILAFGKHRYHILEKVEGPIGRSLLFLLQRIPHRVDTGAEVHGFKKVDVKGKEDFVPAESGGIEVYIPLVDGITFHVNNKVFQPKALGGLITILPGDNHHHSKDTGIGPARVLILGGCGFGIGTKTDKNLEVAKFASIPKLAGIL